MPNNFFKDIESGSKAHSFFAYTCAVFALIFVFWIISGYELYLSKPNPNDPNGIVALIYKLLNDFWSGIVIGLCCFPVFLFISAFKKKVAFIVTGLLFSIIIILQFSLVKYSLETLLNLGADILGYSYTDISNTVTVSETLSLLYFLPFIFFPILFFLINFLIKHYIQKRIVFSAGALLIVFLGLLKFTLSHAAAVRFQNKTAFLVTDIIKFQTDKNDINAFNLNNRNDFPLLKPFDSSIDVLSPLLTSGIEKPNIVFIVVEGLGAEFVRGNTFSGFTPYFDELASKSLYWENFVSTTGRSFGILPSLFGSLPYGEKGFLELENTPSHISLISILKANEYYTSYYSGGPSGFDRKVNFLEYSGIDNLIDESKYGSDFIKTEAVGGEMSWGYPDREIFRKSLLSMQLEKQPRLDIIMTLSNHEPFEFPNKKPYLLKADSIIKTSQKPKSLKRQLANHRDIFGCLLYTDNALKEFMNAYSKRPDYNNTIFIITGDHRLIPITQKDELCRFHVPFLIYSPMLKGPKSFKSLSSHWDVTPSLLNYLTNNYRLKPIKKTPWMGTGLDTLKTFGSTKSIPLMKYKGSINDMIYKEYLLSDDKLFKIKADMQISKVENDSLKQVISDSLLAFKRMNAYVTQRHKIFPDSLNIYVTPKIEFSERQIAKISQYNNDKTFDELFVVAQNVAAEKKYETAQLLCDYILNEFPNYTDALLLKGRTLAWQQDYENSETILLNAMQRSPYYDDVYLAILDLYWWSDQEDKSIAIFNKALKNKLTNTEIGFKMAKAYQRLGDIKKASKLMDSILTIQPKNTAYLAYKRDLK